MYPWPFGEFDSVMDDALNVAMTRNRRPGSFSGGLVMIFERPRPV
jgi:hypothetical protein